MTNEQLKRANSISNTIGSAMRLKEQLRTIDGKAHHLGITSAMALMSKDVQDRIVDILDKEFDDLIAKLEKEFAAL